MSYPQLQTPEEKLDAAKERLNIPTIVCICGSTRFMQQMTEADLRETAAGNIVLKPGCNMKEPHPLWADPVEAEALKQRLDDLHRAKIRLADQVLVVGDYVGDSTTREIAYARSLGKPVRFTHPEVDPGEPDGDPAAAAGMPPAEYRSESHRLGEQKIREAAQWLRADVGFRVLDALDGTEKQQPDTEAQPPHHRWYTEQLDPVADQWAPGWRFTDRAEAVERYRILSEHGTPAERRLVRETTTYTVEEPAPVAQQPAPLRAELKPWQLLANQPDEPLPQTERVIGGRRLDATVDPTMCPRCKGDNSEAFELCTSCAQAEQPPAAEEA